MLRKRMIEHTQLKRRRIRLEYQSSLKSPNEDEVWMNELNGSLSLSNKDQEVGSSFASQDAVYVPLAPYAPTFI
jgi:hypothetical protein